MSKAILDAIKTRLYATTDLTNATYNRIYLDRAPADSRYPLLVYRIADIRTTNFFAGMTRHELQIDFSIYGKDETSTDLYTIANAIESALSTSITVTGFDAARAVRLSRGVPSMNEDSWTMTERYRVVAHDT